MVPIGSVMAGVADGADMSEEERNDILLEREC
jgi:hypothetical protein